jgi:acyl carrier protein
MNILDLIGYVETALGRRLEDDEIVMSNFTTVRAIARTFLTDGR